jgi:hypothetical protein
LSSYLVD